MKKGILAAALAGFILSGCSNQTGSQPATGGYAASPATPEPVKEYQLEGEIISVNLDKKSAVINHKAIEGFMDAMKMSYSIPDQADLEKLKAGDHITATVYHSPSEGRLWLGKVEIQK